MYTKPSHEMHEIKVRIEKAYKNVWKLKSKGSRRIQINPMVIGQQLCQKYFMVCS